MGQESMYHSLNLFSDIFLMYYAVVWSQRPYYVSLTEENKRKPVLLNNN